MYDNAPKQNLTIDYSQERISGGFTPMTLDRVVERLQEIDKKIEQFQSFLEIKEDARDRIDQIIKSSEDLDMKIVFMRDYKKIPLKVIADELGYSYEHVRRISSRNPKHATSVLHTS